MRKGLWSPDEDERLVRCITKYVHGSWSDIARKAGLDRCGKSCRRRWMNHLRPDLKRGKFSMDEINLIVQLQEALGNRWSDIASHLDGRTDNDVKNLWNTQIKKRLAQLKAQNSSSSALSSTFNSKNQTTYAASSSSNICMPEKMNHMDNSMTCVEFSEACDDNLVVRFGSNVSGILDCSCSASSCDGHIADDSSYNQENNSSYWKPNMNVSLEPHDNPMHQLSWGNNHDRQVIHSVYNGKFAENELGTESRAADNHDSLMLITSCSSRSSSINNPMNLQMKVDFVQPDLFPADMDEHSSAAVTTSMCKQPTVLENYQGNQLNFAGTAVTSASILQSTTSCRHFTSVKADTACAAAGGITAVDDHDECCTLGSPNHSKSHINHTFNYLQACMSKNQQTCLSNDLFNLCNVTEKVIKCSPNSKKSSENLAMSTRTAPGPQIRSSIAMDAEDGGNINYVNARLAEGSNGVQVNMSRSAQAGAIDYENVVPASTKIPDNQLALMWEDRAINGADQLQLESIINCTQGWDQYNNNIMVGETYMSSNMTLPQFSLPDWCKQLLQGVDFL